jgi:pimeloyl-ACP methyl ester carboxylesterase
LPGTLNDAALWRAQIKALGGVADIRVADFTSQPSIAAMAEDAIATMPDGRFALAGFSLGGFVAFEILRRAAKRVLGVALVNTQARPEPPESRPGRERMMALAGRDLPGLTGALIQFMLPPQRQGDAELMAAVLSMMNRADSRATMAAIDCPTLVIGGMQDKVAPPKLSEEMAAAIPGAQLHLLADTGHLAPLERPTEVIELMRAWLTQLQAHQP